MELVTGENASILGIQAEYDTDTQDIQPSQSFRRIIVILCQQDIIDAAYYLTSLKLCDGCLSVIS